MLNMFIDCTMDMLSLLIAQLNKNSITFDEFYENTFVKINFLQDNIFSISNDKKQEKVIAMINHYKNILVKRPV